MNSRIEWTEATWNPVTGCTKISPGCKFCYAERMAERLKAMGKKKYRNEFDLTLHPDALDTPLHWKQPKMIFVNSMSDLFHERVPVEFIRRVFETIRAAPWHRFQILTKRSGFLAGLSPHLDWPSNLWMGVSVESETYLFRVDNLRRTGAAVKFLSLEPLLGPLPSLDLTGIDWVIVGGESGPGARPMPREWVVEIRDRCLEAGVPFFFKQWGAWVPWNQLPEDSAAYRRYDVLYGTEGRVRTVWVGKKKAGRLLDGESYDALPRIARPLGALAALHRLPALPK